MAARPEIRTGRVLVHLSEVPEAKRVTVANRIIKTEGLTGVPAMRMRMAALVPQQDPWIEVEAAVARRVLGRRR